MLGRMRNPQEPPGRSPLGTLLGLAPPSVAAPTPRLAAPPAPPVDPLERVAEGLRVELVYFRQWLPGQLVELRRLTRARRRELGRQALVAVAGAALALLLALVSGAAALSWPAYGRLVARAARLEAPPAPGAQR